jgi:hypothetical protein
VKAGQTKVMRLLPIRVQNPTGGVVTTSASRYDLQSVSLVVWPNSARVLPKEDSYKVTVAPPGSVRITVHDAPSNALNYRVVPGSRHRVTITDLARPAAPDVPNKKSAARKGPTPSPRPPAPPVRILTADAQGRLTIEASGSALVVDIQPAS